jgi:hypothetical protein
MFVAEDVWCGEDCCRRQSNWVVSCSNLSCRVCFVRDAEEGVGLPVSVAGSDAASTLVLPGRLVRREPPTAFEVVLALNFRLGLSKRCSLYSTGPSWGSACKRTAADLAPGISGGRGASCLLLIRPLCGVRAGVPPVTSCHGEATRGGSGSNVKMDAILFYGQVALAWQPLQYFEEERQHRIVQQPTQLA